MQAEVRLGASEAGHVKKRVWYSSGKWWEEFFLVSSARRSSDREIEQRRGESGKRAGWRQTEGKQWFSWAGHMSCTEVTYSSRLSLRLSYSVHPAIHSLFHYPEWIWNNQFHFSGLWHFKVSWSSPLKQLRPLVPKVPHISLLPHLKSGVVKQDNLRRVGGTEECRWGCCKVTEKTDLSLNE